MASELYEYPAHYYEDGHQRMAQPVSKSAPVRIDIVSKSDHQTGDSKPRLTKEQHEILEAHFQKEYKPSTSTKRAFAERLGVPLDKVNNWFQNRRAKTKQDARKAQGVFNLYGFGELASPQFQLAPCSPTFCDPEFFQTLMHTMAHRRQQHPLDGVEDDEYFQLGAGYDSPDPPELSVSPTLARNGSAGSGAHDASSLSTPGSCYNNGLQAVQHAYRPSLDSYEDCGPPSGIVKSELSENGKVANGHELQHSAMFALDPFPEQSPWGASNHFGSMLSTPLPGPDEAQWLHDRDAASQWGLTPQFITSPGVYNMLEEGTSHGPQFRHMYSHGLTQAHATVPEYQAPPVLPSNFFQGDMGHPVTEYFGPGDQVQQQASRPPTGHELPVQVQRRCIESDPSGQEDNSKAFALADSSSATEIPPLPRHGPAFKVPKSESSIAARRHQRPKTLSGPAFRSVSYNDALPPSPGAQGNHLTPEQSLRRIKSSGIPGGGRILKSYQGSAQRSPLSYSFPEVTTSPTTQRHYPANSYIAASASMPFNSGMLAPPTPLSPYEVVTDNFQQSRGTTLHHQRSSGTGIPWNLGFENMVSPPETPLDANHHMQMRSTNLSDTATYGIQSAPAWQQSFPDTSSEAEEAVCLSVHTGGANGWLPVTRPPLSRVASVPAASNYDPFAGHRYPCQPANPSPGLPQRDIPYGVPSQMAQADNAPSGLQQGSIPFRLPIHPTKQSQEHAPATSAPLPDLFVHEWSPPRGSKPPPRQLHMQPRHYTFSNIGPDAYSSP